MHHAPPKLVLKLLNKNVSPVIYLSDLVYLYWHKTNLKVNEVRRTVMREFEKYLYSNVWCSVLRSFHRTPWPSGFHSSLAFRRTRIQIQAGSRVTQLTVSWRSSVFPDKSITSVYKISDFHGGKYEDDSLVEYGAV
jgi:hypothetical protein